MLPNRKIGLAALLGASLSSAVPAPAHWSWQASGTAETLEGISFFSPDTGYLCGSGGLLRRTTDGGRTWEALAPPYAGTFIHKVHFRNGREGLIRFGTDSLARTEDGGRTWIPAAPEARIEADELMWDDRGNHYVGDFQNRLWRSADAGRNWTLAPIEKGDAVGLFTALHFPSPDTGFAVSSQGLFRSTDGGANWSLLAPAAGAPFLGAGQFPSMFFINPREGCLARPYYSLIACTRDGGLSLSLASTEMTNAIHFTTPDTGYAACSRGRILRTVDRGKTWDEAVDILRENVALRALAFPAPDRGFAVGDSGTLLRFEGAPAAAIGKAALRPRPVPSGSRALRFDAAGKRSDARGAGARESRGRILLPRD